MSSKRAPTDVGIADLAGRQYGLVTARQLGRLGLSSGGISGRVRTGRLHRVHRGVYAVGHRALGNEARWMAAVLACGPGATLSHGSAAALWALLRPLDGPVDVTVPTHAGRRKREGIRIHRCASLDPGGGARSLTSDEQTRPAPLVTVRKGISVTSVPRTIDDLRGVLPPRLVRRAQRQAELIGYQFAGSDRTRSDLERAFLRLCRAHGLSMPLVNVRLGRWLVDFLWPAERLVVETDFWRYHRGSVAFEDDHARELDLRGLGYEVRRFTDRQIEAEPERVVADLRAALSRPRGTFAHQPRTNAPRRAP